MLSRICLECDRANAPDAKFCSDCGSPLQVKLCKHCHKANDYAAHFCQGCGRSLPVPDPARAGTATGSDSTATAPAAGSPLFAARSPAPVAAAASALSDEATIVRAFSGARAAPDTPAFAPAPAPVIEAADPPPLVLDPPPGYRPPMVIHRSTELRPRRATPAWLLGASVVVLIASVLVLTLGRGGVPVSPSSTPPSSTVKPAAGGEANGVAPTSSSAAPAAAVLAVEADKARGTEPAKPLADSNAATGAAPAAAAARSPAHHPAAADATPAPTAAPAARPAARECTQDLAVLGLCRPESPNPSASPAASSAPDLSASSEERK
jgi:ribosomal protein L40E